MRHFLLALVMIRFHNPKDAVRILRVFDRVLQLHPNRDASNYVFLSRMAFNRSDDKGAFIYAMKAAKELVNA